LFGLAHELGHIACGHLENNSLLIDEKINEDDVDNPKK
jgi:Zn-dependent peptidase ImmA (M78 family)